MNVKYIMSFSFFIIKIINSFDWWFMFFVWIKFVKVVCIYNCM